MRLDTPWQMSVARGLSQEAMMNGIKKLEELLAQSDMHQVRSMENKQGVICIVAEFTSLLRNRGGRADGSDSG